MSFMPEIREVSEDFEVKSQSGQMYSQRALEKYDKILGDNELDDPECKNEFNELIQSGQMYSQRALEKYDKILGDDDIDEILQGNSVIEETKPRYIPTINEGMEGKSIDGVKFIRKVFTLYGEKVEGVFPVFESKFNVKLPEILHKASDNEQMRYCTKKLAERIERDPEFANEFSPRQLEQIKNREPRISGLTWHHNEIPGKMQLVDANEHSAARHTGGKSIWGGGRESR